VQTLAQSSLTHTRDASIRGYRILNEATCEENTVSRTEKEFLRYSMPMKHVLTGKLQHVTELSTPQGEIVLEDFTPNDYLVPL